MLLEQLYAVRSKSIISCLFTPVTPIFEPCLMSVAHGFKNLFEMHFVRRHIFKQDALVEVMPVYKQIINRKGVQQPVSQPVVFQVVYILDVIIVASFSVAFNVYVENLFYGRTPVMECP